MDQQLLFLMNRQWIHPALDRLMAVVTDFGLWAWPILGLALGVALRGGFRGRVFLLTAGLAVLVNDGFVSRPLKRWVDRPRPFQSHNEVRQVELSKKSGRLAALAAPLKIKMSRSVLRDVDGRSFPSSHTMNTIAVALVCAVFYRRLGWLAFLPALAVAYSRIYTGSHWPSDVFTSVFLGLGVTLLLLAFLDGVWRRLGSRLFPSLAVRHPALFGTPASPGRWDDNPSLL
jgi:undecaprenyl-diphosphatase